VIHSVQLIYNYWKNKSYEWKIMLSQKHSIKHLLGRKLLSILTNHYYEHVPGGQKMGIQM
jgi:hypothetical protein